MEKPPSRIRYENAHPVLSARVSKDTRDLLHELRREAGTTWDDMLLGLVATNDDLAKENEELKGRLTLEVEEARAEAYGRGREEGRGRFEIPCGWCGRPLELDTRTDAGVRVRLRRALRNYGHEACG